MGIMRNLDRSYIIFIENFSNHARCWSDATDDIRSFCEMVTNEYNDNVEDPINKVEPLNFYDFKRPSIWNTKAKFRIGSLWFKLSQQSKTLIIQSHI